MELAPAQRVTRYLERQIAWFRGGLAEAEALDTADAEALAAWGEHLPKRITEFETLAREHDALLREWQRADAPDAERRAVRALADEAESLRAALESHYAELAQAVAERMTETDQALTALRRGQGMLQGYRPGGTAEPGYLDRKA